MSLAEAWNTYGVRGYVPPNNQQAASNKVPQAWCSLVLSSEVVERLTGLGSSFFGKVKDTKPDAVDVASFREHKKADEFMFEVEVCQQAALLRGAITG